MKYRKYAGIKRRCSPFLLDISQLYDITPIICTLCKLYGDLELVKLPPGLTVEAAISRLQNHPAVSYAEDNMLYQHQAISNDPIYTDGRLWGMRSATSLTFPNQFGSQADEA